MKKALVVLLVLACVSAMAFADGATPKWSIANLYGFGIYMPSASGSSTMLEQYDYSKIGGDRTRFGFTYTAADGNAGFNSRLEMTSSFAATFNQLNGWGKLFGGLLTVRGGLLDDYTISGTGDWLCLGNTDGKLGIFFDVTPMAGLDIGFFQVIPAASTGLTATGDIIGAKYAVPNLVTVGAGVVLSGAATKNVAPNIIFPEGVAGTGHQVYVGLDLKAVPGLTFTAEAGFTLADGDTNIVNVEDVAYAMGPLTVGAYAGFYNNAGGLDWGVEPRVAYKVNDNLTVNVHANVYDFGKAYPALGTAAPFATPGIGNVSWLTALDAGAVGAGAYNTVNFGGGANIIWAADGFSLTVGDYYGAATGSGNVIYVNADLSL